MLFDPKHEERLGRLQQQLRRAQAITPKLMSDVMVEACVRLPAQSPSARAMVSRLIESGAWTDATLALIELELPQWKVRRLIHEDGEWLCTLSKQPQFPLGLDEVTEVTHEVLPLAILTALLQARCAAAGNATSSTAVPAVRPVAGEAMCCDNFA